jgi:4-amino-4-deoxy-L-arabinose transferase-like glycosyltransferase
MGRPSSFPDPAAPASGRDGRARATSWLRRLARRRGAVVLLLLLTATALRVELYRQASTSPAGWWHRWEESDMAFFDAWGRRLAAGDWLTDTDLHPYHGWHATVAAIHFGFHPEDARALQRQAAERGDPREPGALLWSRWFGGKRFHQEPLYPYLIGLTYALFGPDALLVHLWQLAVGVACVGLLWLVTRRAFGDVAALAAGLLGVFYGPLLVYEVTLLRTTLLALATLALVAALQATWGRRRAWRWLAFGLLAGLAVLLKTTFLLLVAGVLGALLAVLRQRPRASLAAGAALLAGLSLALAPAVARNLAVGAPALSLESVGPLNVILSLSSDSEVNVRGFAPNHGTFAEVMGRTDGRPWPVLLDTLAIHDDVADLALMGVRRMANALSAYEAPNNVNLLAMERDAPVLRLAAAGFGLAAALGLPGLVLALGMRRRRALVGALVLALLAGLAPLVVFGTLARYRVLFALALLPFAGLTVARGLAWASEGRGLRVAALLCFGAGLFVFAHRPLPGLPHGLRTVDVTVPLQTFWGPLAQASLQRDDPAGAAAVLARAAATAPPVLAALGPDHPVADPWEAELADHFAGLWEVLGGCRQQAGDGAGAADAFAEAVRLRSALPAPE